MQGSTDGRIDPNFKKGNAGILGPLIWSELKKKDAGIHGRSNISAILNGNERTHGPTIWSEFNKGIQGSTDRQFGPNFKKNDGGIQGRSNRFEFLKRGMQGSLDR